MTHKNCPNCGNSNTEVFFTIKNAPIQSLITIKSYEEAIAIPQKDIDLTFCNNCGFIFNSSFDKTINHYTQGYEDQQGFSPTFVKFITEISQRFIEKYNIRNKDVIEIGCGKGDFISLFCKLGNNRGIGIDPAYDPKRQKPNPNLKFITEFYSEEHGNLPNDVITCRHTLEHIPETNEFLSLIRKSIGNKKDAIMFFEVPSIVRILDIQAFWDIFYEHCTYLSPGSLARLFRKNGFEILDLYLEYDNQYLFIEAQPVDKLSEKIHPLEESIEELKSYVNKFVKNLNKQLDEWRIRLAKYDKQGKKVMIWGGGSKCVGFLTQFNDMNVIKDVVDINPHMHGNYIPGIGLRYSSPDNLKDIMPDVVIILNGVYENEVTKMLNEKDLFPEIVCL